MEPTEKEWAQFGRWMAVCSGVVMFTLAIGPESALLAAVLRIWVGFLGVYFLWFGLFR